MFGEMEPASRVDLGLNVKRNQTVLLFFFSVTDPADPMDCGSMSAVSAGEFMGRVDSIYSQPFTMSLIFVLALYIIWLYI